jgi:hypothetical protein
VPADHSQVHAARLYRGKDCTKAQVTPQLIRRGGRAEHRQSPALWDILNLCMNEIGHRNHTSNPAPPLSVNCAAGVILPCSPSATSPWCNPFWTRHCCCMNLHLFDPDPADPALLPVNCAADVVLHCQDLHESPGAIGLGMTPSRH